MKERAASFLKQAEASITASKHLLEQGDYPGFVVSRSYYSMFYCVTALMEEDGQRFSSHGQALGAFGRDYIRTQKLPARLHASLLKAFHLRSVGDYDPSQPLSIEEARESIKDAEEFLAETQHYFSNLK
ncbi:MAG: HEPN domain-containing protein [Chthoniobacteraceae bacterium]